MTYDDSEYFDEYFVQFNILVGINGWNYQMKSF